MKKLNLSLFIAGMTLLSIIPFQTASASYVLLKKDDPNTSTEPMTTRAPIRLPLIVSQNETDLSLNFNYSVGIVQITIEDELGGIMYQEVLDTNTNTSLLIETADWDGGNYKLKVSYGSINLSGSFSL